MDSVAPVKVEPKVLILPAEKSEPPKINPTGMRKLLPGRIQQLLYQKKPEDEPPLSLRELILAIVRIENAHRKREADKKNTRLRPIKQLEIQWDPNNYSGFDCLAFMRKFAGTTKSGKALKELGAKGKQKDVYREYFSFFFREKEYEIYIVTEGRTWEIVRRYTDYEWPMEVCQHFFDPNRITHVTRESIFGEERKEQIDYPQCQRLELLEGRERLYTKIVLPFRRDCSFYTLSPFQTSGGHRPSTDTVVDVQVGQIKIHRTIPFTAFPMILDHISTHLEEPIPQRIQEQFEILEYLQKVDDDTERAAFIDFILGQIVDAIKKQTSCPFVLGHKYLTDYLYSSADCLTVRIHRKKHTVSRYARFRDIVEVMRLYLPNLSKLTLEDAKNEVQRVSISYDGEKFFPLLDLVEGELRVKGVAYFRLNKCFYKLSGDYLSLIHVDFRRSLGEILMDEKHPGVLPLPWGGQRSHGHLTETAAGGKATLASLANTKVTYLELKNTQANIQFHSLKGEILTHPLVNRHRDAIEQLLAGRQQMTKFSLQTGLGISPEAGEEIWKELTQERSLLIEEKGKYYVTNPLVHDVKLSKALDPLCFTYFARETEGNYNERYLDEKQAIVGDRVCPFGIEIFDIVRYDDKTTYIYHVKEGFDLHARDALDQLMNAVELIYEARNADTDTTVLDEWFRKASNPKEKGVKKEDQAYREKLAKQMKKLGLKAFKEIFLKRRLVFVYAVLDHHNQECTLSHEKQLKEAFSAADFIGMIKTGKKVSSNAIFKDLKKQHYLTNRGRLGSQFYATSKEHFPEQFPLDISKAAKERIYDTLHDQASQFNSTIALLTLRRARKRVSRFNFDFQVCQIKRDSYDETIPFELPSSFHETHSLSVTPPSLTYEYNGDAYEEELPTRGDGACALHALNADHEYNNENVFMPDPGATGADIGMEAKNDFLDKLDDHHNDHLDLFYACIEEYLDLHPSLRKAYQTQIAPHEDAVQQAKDNLDAFYLSLLDQPVYNQLFKELQSTSQKYNHFTSQKLKTHLKGDPQSCTNTFNATLSTIQPILQTQPGYTPRATALAQAQQARDQTQQAYYTSQAIRDHYRKHVLSPSYHLSDNELRLATYLYNKQVILFSEHQEPQTLNPTAPVTVAVAILHEGDQHRGHYTRLEST